MASNATALVDGNYDAALLLAAGALGVQDTPQARGSLLATLEANPEHTGFLHSSGGTVTAVTWSPLGNLVASGTADGQIGVWDMGDIGRVREFRAAPSSAATSLRFSPDESLLAVGSEDGSIEVWEVRTGQRRLSPAAAPKRVGVLRFGSGGRVLAWGSGGDIGIFDLASGQEIGRSTIGIGVSHLVFQNEGRVLLVIDNDGRITTVDGGTARAAGPSGRRNVSAGSIVTAFAEDASFVATASVTSQVALHDIARGETLGDVFDGPGSIDEMAFSLDGSLLAVGGSGVVEVWDPRTQILKGRLTGYSGLVLALEFSPDGTAIAASTGSAVVISDLNRSHRLGQILSEPKEVANVVRGVAKVSFSTDGKTLTFVDVPGSGRMEEVAWDVHRNVEVRRDSVTGNPMQRDSPAAARGDDVTSWARSADLKSVAVGHRNGDVTLHESTSSKETKRLQPGTATTDLRGSVVHEVEFSADGRMLAVASTNDVTLWALDTAQRVARFPTGQTSGIALSPDGRTAAALTADGVLTLFDVAGRQRLGVLRQSIAQPAAVDVEFSPDGRLLASAVSGGGVALWDMDSQSWRAEACQLAGRDLSISEIEQFVGLRYRKVATCG